MDRYLKRKAPESDKSESEPSTSSSSSCGHSVKEVETSSITYGFIFAGNPSCPLPLCLLCGDWMWNVRNVKLSNQAMVPSKLKRHLTTNHPSHANQSKEYFVRLKSKYSRQEQVMFKCAKVSKNALASYLVAKIIAKAKKPHTIAEQVIVPACTAIVNKMIGPQAAKEIANVGYHFRTQT